AENFTAAGRGDIARGCRGCRRDCAAAGGTVFFSHAAAGGASAARGAVDGEAAGGHAASVESRDGGAACIYRVERFAGEGLRARFAVSRVAVRVAAGKNFGGTADYAGRNRRARSGAGGVAPAVWSAGGVDGGGGAGVGSDCGEWGAGGGGYICFDRAVLRSGG